MKYRVTKKFTGGLLNGLTITEETPVRFDVGFKAKRHPWVSPDPYTVTACEPIGCTVDWTDLESVKAFARKLGEGQTVFKRNGRPNYNITHTSRTDRYRPDEVVFQTPSR